MELCWVSVVESPPSLSDMLGAKACARQADGISDLNLFLTACIVKQVLGSVVLKRDHVARMLNVRNLFPTTAEEPSRSWALPGPPGLVLSTQTGTDSPGLL